MSTILVTGNCGFIGSHLSDALVQEGHEVIGIDDLSTGNIKNLNPQVNFYQGSITDTALVERVFQNHRIDKVYHLAAKLDLRRSFDYPSEDAQTNIIGSLVLIQEALKSSKKHPLFFNFISTAGGLFSGSAFSWEERTKPKPKSPYGLAKLTVENYLYLLKKQSKKFDFHIYRLSNVYGPRQDGSKECGVIAIFIKNILNNQPLVVFGSGEQTRNYIYVRDVVNSLITPVTKGRFYLNQKNCKISHLCTKDGQTSVNELIGLLKKQFGCNQDVIYKKAIPGEVLTTPIDTIRLLPATLGIKEGLRQTWQWYLQERS